MPRYDLVVIGGGTAGLVTAAGSAGLGARVALVERERLGGECLWTGCVPSKALIAAARSADSAGSRSPAERTSWPSAGPYVSSTDVQPTPCDAGRQAMRRSAELAGSAPLRSDRLMHRCAGLAGSAPRRSQDHAPDASRKTRRTTRSAAPPSSR